MQFIFPVVEIVIRMSFIRKESVCGLIDLWRILSEFSLIAKLDNVFCFFSIQASGLFGQC